jgi:hypothetical protein
LCGKCLSYNRLSLYKFLYPALPTEVFSVQEFVRPLWLGNDTITISPMINQACLILLWKFLDLIMTDPVHGLDRKEFSVVRLFEILLKGLKKIYIKLFVCRTLLRTRYSEVSLYIWYIYIIYLDQLIIIWNSWTPVSGCLFYFYLFCQFFSNIVTTSIVEKKHLSYSEIGEYYLNNLTFGKRHPYC